MHAGKNTKQLCLSVLNIWRIAGKIKHLVLNSFQSTVEKCIETNNINLISKFTTETEIHNKSLQSKATFTVSLFRTDNRF